MISQRYWRFAVVIDVIDTRNYDGAMPEIYLDQEVVT